MTTLVTGGTGFIGSAVIRALLNQGLAVRALVRPASDRGNLEGLDVEVVVGDLGDPASLTRAVRGARGVYHVAADYRLWVPDPEAMYRTNLQGTRQLLLAAADAGAERIVYTSSVATIGRSVDSAQADETTGASLEGMIGHYKRSKFLAERAVLELTERRRLPVVVVNPSTPVGPRDVKPTPTGRMVLEAARGRVPAYVETGLNLVHVDDVARGHLQAAARGRIGERYILGGEDRTLGDILTLIARLVGRRPPRLRLRPGAVLPIAHLAQLQARLLGRGEPLVTVDGVRMSRQRMYYSSAKAAQELDHRARPAEEALRDAIAWFRNRGELG